jgi:hypothetical protein
MTLGNMGDGVRPHDVSWGEMHGRAVANCPALIWAPGLFFTAMCAGRFLAVSVVKILLPAQRRTPKWTESIGLGCAVLAALRDLNVIQGDENIVPDFGDRDYAHVVGSPVGPRDSFAILASGPRPPGLGVGLGRKITSPSLRGRTSHSPRSLAVSPRVRGSHLVHGVATTYFDEALVRRPLLSGFGGADPLAGSTKNSERATESVLASRSRTSTVGFSSRLSRPPR